MQKESKYRRQEIWKKGHTEKKYIKKNNMERKYRRKNGNTAEKKKGNTDEGTVQVTWKGEWLSK